MNPLHRVGGGGDQDFASPHGGGWVLANPRKQNFGKAPEVSYPHRGGGGGGCLAPWTHPPTHRPVQQGGPEHCLVSGGGGIRILMSTGVGVD